MKNGRSVSNFNVYSLKITIVENKFARKQLPKNFVQQNVS
jgi:hypothetical protein